MFQKLKSCEEEIAKMRTKNGNGKRKRMSGRISYYLDDFEGFQEVNEVVLLDVTEVVLYLVTSCLSFLIDQLDEMTH